MTDRERDNTIFNDFLDIEARANATPRGADHMQIVKTLATKYGVSQDDVRGIVVRHSIAGPC